MLYVDNVSFAYPGGKYVLRNLSFQIEEGEYVAIVGPNGSGKSTVSKLIDGLVLPQKGTITVEKLCTHNPEELKQIRKKVGIVFQNPDDQLITTTVFDEIIFGLENISCPPEMMGEKAEDALRKVGMLAFRDFEPHKLSGGQKQKVAIATIIAMKPKLMIFDESTSMLDPVARQQIIKIMHKLHQEGLSIIHITHDMEEVMKAERVIILNKGQIMREGTPVEIFHEPSLIENHYLQAPFIIRVKEYLGQAGFSIPDDILDVEGLIEELWKLN